jgi:hypothetical protein
VNSKLTILVIVVCILVSSTVAYEYGFNNGIATSLIHKGLVESDTNLANYYQGWDGDGYGTWLHNNNESSPETTPLTSTASNSNKISERLPQITTTSNKYYDHIPESCNPPVVYLPGMILYHPPGLVVYSINCGDTITKFYGIVSNDGEGMIFVNASDGHINPAGFFEFGDAL